MKLTKRLLLCALLLVDATEASLKECEWDCDHDKDCAEGLLCSDDHENDLRMQGYDPQRAYCNLDASVPRNFDVCYDPAKVTVKGPGAPVEIRGNKKECEFDCDLDSECEVGLLCADEHMAELMANGFDPAKANCQGIDPGPVFEVCFKASILPRSGGSFGDPHFRTFDGTKFSYHGECDLVLTRGLYHESMLPIDVHVRTTLVDDWSLIANVAIRIGDETFEVVNDGTVYWKGQETPEMPIQISGGRYSVNKNEEIVQSEDEESGTIKEITHTTYTIQLDQTDTIVVGNWLKMLSVNVNAYLSGAEGMIGVRQAPGMVGRDHKTTFTNPNDLGAEWQVRDSDGNLFHDSTREPQYPTQCKLPSVTSRRRRLGETSYLHDKAVAACAGIVDGMDEFCVEDVLLTGDIHVAKAYHERRSF